MCGINGFNWEERELIDKMNDTTKHRGPDGTGAYCGGGVSLGHNRLAIIDLRPEAAQPMTSADGNTTIVFNGEIYNFQELKKELADYPYKTMGDTEVILAAYQKWGTDAFTRLNGIFAFAIWDAAQKKLILARDRGGVKPLYYHSDGKRLIFSSEIKAILDHDIARELDRESLVHYLRVLYVPAPHTMFRQIKKLEPGHMLTLQGGVMSMRSFVDPAHGAYTGRITDTALREVIDAAVTRQLVSDRPLGIYLSGGFDSSIILDSASRVRSSINTFSTGFTLDADETPEKYNTDQALARRTAEYYGATHHEVMLSSDDVAEIFERMVWHLDEPTGNTTAIPMMCLAHFTKPLATVVCGGDGGDELFGGYERYRLSLLSSYYRMLPPPLRAIGDRLNSKVGKLDTAPGVDRFARFLFQKDDVLTRVLRSGTQLDVTRSFFKDKFFAKPMKGSFEDIFMDVDRRSWLVDESLMQTDKMSMSAGVEARVPFLDNEVVAFAARIPRSQKLTLTQSKRMLKRAFRGRLPEYLYSEPKRGWFPPAGRWLRHERFGALAREILSPSYCEATRDLFQWDEIEAMLKGHQDSSEYHLTMLWALMVFQSWAKQYRITL
ncbi:asparagine synthase (glutamine-hydrolyzing) [Candidatus Kaiserbacteria bacterium]|nr:asparagine synthase (glutamine-hydrolyzing) [Candidatus Kaiserbacteria bacterium]